MKQTKKLTLSAMLVALGTVFMVLGAVIEVFDLTAVALASVLVAFVYIELGSPYTWLVWICTTLCTFLFYQHSAMWFIYLVLFGIYPILKYYIEKLPVFARWILKLLFFNAALVALIFLSELIIGVPFFTVEDRFAEFALFIKAGLYVGFNIAFVLYDIFLNVMIRVYYQRFRTKFLRFLK